jgi:hypothetical protein
MGGLLDALENAPCIRSRLVMLTPIRSKSGEDD